MRESMLRQTMHVPNACQFSPLIGLMLGITTLRDFPSSVGPNVISNGPTNGLSIRLLCYVWSLGLGAFI